MATEKTKIFILTETIGYGCSQDDPFTRIVKARTSCRQ